MKMGMIVLVISFLLDGFLSLWLPFQFNRLFILKAMFTITTLVVIYPYFNHKNSRFYQAGLLFGFLYDIIYTNTWPFNTLVFLLLCYLIIVLNYLLVSNMINLLIMQMVVLVSYELLSFLILNIIGYTTIYLSDVIFKATHSLLLNLFYGWLLLMVLNLISDKYKIKRLD